MRCVDTCDGCNDVTGVCDQGCLPGFKGYVCHEGKSYKKSSVILRIRLS